MIFYARKLYLVRGGSPAGDNAAIFALTEATATFSSFTAPSRTVTF